LDAAAVDCGEAKGDDWNTQANGSSSAASMPRTCSLSAANGSGLMSMAPGWYWAPPDDNPRSASVDQYPDRAQWGSAWCHFATAICSAKPMGPICRDAIALRRRYVNPNVGFDCYRSRRLVRCFRQPHRRGDGNKRTPPMPRKPHPRHPRLMTVTFVGASRVLINLPSVLGHQRSD
jgi:hypothetical protein